RSIHAERCSAPASVSMTLRRLPERETEALAFNAGVAANFASSANWRGVRVRLDILPNILLLVAQDKSDLPRRLQLKATSFSAWHSRNRTVTPTSSIGPQTRCRRAHRAV